MISVFVVIGASFGPVCGAMLADFLLAGRKWSGPRASFNPAGWISWIVGFVVGAFNLVVPLLLRWDWASKTFPHLADYQDYIPVPPVTAFVVGFVLYIVFSVVGLRTRKLLEARWKADRLNATCSAGQTFLSAISAALLAANRNVCPTVLKNAAGRRIYDKQKPTDPATRGLFLRGCGRVRRTRSNAWVNNRREVVAETARVCP